MCSPELKQPWCSLFNFSLSGVWHILLSYTLGSHQWIQGWAGVYTRLWWPFRSTCPSSLAFLRCGWGRAEMGLCHERYSRQGSGWWVSGGLGAVYTNASWQCGLFPSNTQVCIHYIYTKGYTQTHAVVVSCSWSFYHKHTFRPHPGTAEKLYVMRLSEVVEHHFFVTNPFMLLHCLNVVPLLNPSWWAAQWKRQSSL